MTLKEERMQILKMLEEGKISANDAAQLLSALEMGAARETEAASGSTPRAKARWLRIRVTDQASGKQKVSVNLPMGLVKVGMKMGARFTPGVEGVDLQELAELIDSGAEGKIIEVDDHEDGEHVEIFVE